VRLPTLPLLVAAGTAALVGATPPSEPSPRGQGERTAARGQAQEDLVPAPPGRGFYFTRAQYTGFGRRRWGGNWATDYPKADRQFLVGVRHLTGVDAYERENPVRLDDPALGRFPFLYALEVGYMSLTASEVAGLRAYLDAGGFLVIDDFWGSQEWANFEQEIHRVLPEYAIVDLAPDHPMLHAFYDIDRILQVPAIGGGIGGRPTWERDGYEPKLRGIFDDDGRLLVVINWNTDLGDAWEWAEDPWYPLDRSNFAYQLGINLIVYAMSH
jgi:hypothetical protein